MRTLWVLVVGLGLIYLIVYEAGRANTVPRPVVSPTIDQGGNALADSAKGDAIARSVSGATLETESVKPALFKGDDLQKVGGLTAGSTAGFEIIIVAKVEGKPVSRLRYHAVPPSKIVFVGQETAR